MDVSEVGFYQFGRLALGLFGVTAVVAQTGVFVGREVQWRFGECSGWVWEQPFGGLLLQ